MPSGLSPPGLVVAAIAGMPPYSAPAGGWWVADAAWDAPVASPPPSAAAASIDYTAEDLDMLALLFTVVKLLFVGGALARARVVTDLVETARAASSTPLHETLIRNEAAYFGCVTQLLREYPAPPLSALETPIASSNDGGFLYLAGDSHCLPGAWRTVHLRGAERRLAPVLVTGLKAWHLRPESRFYPKLNFQAALAKLPDGAQVVFLFGEIDCRESLLVSVDRGRYENLEEGIEAVVAIYVAVLIDLVRARNWEIFVHPVPPVLDVTVRLRVEVWACIGNK